MKNKHNRALCILMCIVLIASVFTACGIKDDETTTTLAPVTDGNWQNEVPEDITYSKLNFSNRLTLQNLSLGLYYFPQKLYLFDLKPFSCLHSILVQ